MNRIGKLLAVGFVAFLAVGMAFAEDEGKGDGTQRERMRRGRGGQRGRGIQWFMNLPDAQAEMEKHKEKMQEIGEARKALAEERREEAEKLKNEAGDDEKPDKEAIDAKIEEHKKKILDLAKQMLEEHVRHHRAIADILEQNTDKALADLEKKMEQFRANRAGKGGGGNRMRRRNGNGGNNEDFEGAVF